MKKNIEIEDMGDSTTISVRISTETKERLSRLAQETKRSRAYLAAEAIDEFVALNEWQIAETKKARDAADSGGPFVSHEDMSAWLLSWGTDDELPVPEANIRRP